VRDSYLSAAEPFYTVSGGHCDLDIERTKKIPATGPPTPTGVFIARRVREAGVGWLSNALASSGGVTLRDTSGGASPSNWAGCRPGRRPSPLVLFRRIPSRLRRRRRGTWRWSTG
jgi:hypothetical protein